MNVLKSKDVEGRGQLVSQQDAGERAVRQIVWMHGVREERDGPLPKGLV